MSILALAFALLAAPLPAQAEPRSAVGLALYKQVCFDLASYPAARARIEAAGWMAYAPEAGTPMARHADYRGKGFGNVLRHAEYRHATEGGDVYLFLMEAKERSGFGTGVHCRLYDPVARALPSEAQITAWAGHEPTSTLTAAKGWVWWPGVGAGQDQTNVELIDSTSIFAEDGPGLSIWSIDKPEGME